MVRLGRILGALALAVALLPAAASAKDHGPRHGQAVRGDRDHDRDRGRHRDFDSDDRPPGWSKGRKTGWRNDCDLPPGQAKKVGCTPLHRHVIVHHHRRHRDHDHDRDDMRIRRRRGDGDHDRDDRR